MDKQTNQLVDPELKAMLNTFFTLGVIFCVAITYNLQRDREVDLQKSQLEYEYKTQVHNDTMKMMRDNDLKLYKFNYEADEEQLK